MSGTLWPTITANDINFAANVNAKFDWLNETMIPMNSGSSTDNAYNLGETGNRFKNIYIGSQLILSSATSTVMIDPNTTTSGIKFTDDVTARLMFFESVGFKNDRTMLFGSACAMGIDSADGNKLKVAYGSSIGATNLMTINPATNIVKFGQRNAFYGYRSANTSFSVSGGIGFSTFTFDTATMNLGGLFQTGAAYVTFGEPGYYYINLRVEATWTGTVALPFQFYTALYNGTAASPLTTTVGPKYYAYENQDVADKTFAVVNHLVWYNQLTNSAVSFGVAIGDSLTGTVTILGGADKSRIFGYYLGR